MNILHYALGFPPYRTGGMTKFCMDLMRQQNIDGHQAALLWPGRMKLWVQNVSIRDMGTPMIYNEPCRIRSFEIINPLPVPYDEGISSFHYFEKDAGKESYNKLLQDFQPEVIHIHTLMGLHRSFLEAARERNIRCVFTTHDYFPICPKVTLFRNGKICESAMSCSDCASCNETALSMRKISILQSLPYRFFKDYAIVRSLRKRHRDNYLNSDIDGKLTCAGATESDYRKLRDYYASFLQLMDVIHFNSTIAKKVYEKYFILPESEVINIGHADIADNRKKKIFSRQKLRLTYLGPQGEAKGFFYLRRRSTNYGKPGGISA